MNRADEPGTVHWRTPEELVRIGCRRSRVVIVNEAHNGRAYSVRTREVGRRLLPIAHEMGVRHLAMETVPSRLPDGTNSWLEETNTTRRVPASGGGMYLLQPSTRALIEDALDLGWAIVAYQIPYTRHEYHGLDAANELEAEQARYLADTLRSMSEDARLLIWCGGAHLRKIPTEVRGFDFEPGWPDGGQWVHMAQRFWEFSGVEPFCIDQHLTVRPFPNQPVHPLVDAHAGALDAMGGTAGFLAGEGPNVDAAADAYILSVDNDLVE